MLGDAAGFAPSDFALSGFAPESLVESDFPESLFDSAPDAPPSFDSLPARESVR